MNCKRCGDERPGLYINTSQLIKAVEILSVSAKEATTAFRDFGMAAQRFQKRHPGILG